MPAIPQAASSTARPGTASPVVVVRHGARPLSRASADGTAAARPRGSLSACPDVPALRLARPDHRRDHRRPSPKDSLIEALVISILALAAVVLIVMQVMYRRRVMRRRQAAGQDPVGRGTYVVFAVTAAFFLFAVFVFPLLVRGN